MTEVQTDQSAEERMAALLDKPLAPAWMAKNAGDMVSGAFVTLGSGMTEYGPAPFVILGTAEGEVSVWLFYESLKTGFLREKPQPGELVAIRYEGEKPVKNPAKGRKKTYHDYRVAVDRPEAAPVSWDVLGATVDDREPEAESSEGDPLDEA